MSTTTYTTLAALVRELDRAEKASAAAVAKRAALPAGSSRARATSANAAWSRAAEHRDRIRAQVVAEARRVLPEIVTGLDAWLVTQQDDYGVDDPVVVVLGAEERASEVAAEHGPMASFDKIGVRS